MNKEFSDLLKSINGKNSNIDKAMAFLKETKHIEVASDDMTDILYLLKTTMSKMRTIMSKNSMLLECLDKDKDKLLNSILVNINTFIDATNACSTYDMDWFISLTMSTKAKQQIAQGLIDAIKKFNKTNKLWEGIVNGTPAYIQLINSLNEDI